MGPHKIASKFIGTFLYTLLLSVLLAPTAFAQSNFWYYPVSDAQVLTQLQQGSAKDYLPESFQLMTWNVHKGADGMPFARDLIRLAKSSELVLLQEAMNDDFMPAIYTQLPEFDAWMAQSFAYSDLKSTTGVTTLAKASSEYAFFRRSPDREPITNTPKMTLGTIFQLSNGRPLLVLNIHGINFVLNSSFRRQISDLVPYIESFPGAVILAGDFNTWNGDRQRFLDRITQQLGMSEVKFPNDDRYLVLDHIYAKDCTALTPKIHSEIKTSDHEPLTAVMSCH